MGSSKAASFLPLLLTLSLTPFIHPSHKLVSADETLIQGECHNTQAPNICIQCLKSDPGAEQADKKGIATILTNCLISKADTLAANMSDMASTARDPTMKTDFQQCVTCYGSAKQDLLDVKVALVNNNASEALDSMAAAFKSNFACHIAIITHIKEIPQAIVSAQTSYDELSADATSIINGLSS